MMFCLDVDVDVDAAFEEEEDLRVRNSWVSARTRLRCLSKARNVPVMVRESVRVMRRRCSTYLKSLDPLPLGCFYLDVDVDVDMDRRLVS